MEEKLLQERERGEQMKKKSKSRGARAADLADKQNQLQELLAELEEP